MNSVCIIVNKYPNIIDPNGLVFVQQLVWELADKGIKCNVICPLAININKQYKKVESHVIEKTEKGNIINVYFPKFIGLGQSHYILGKSPVSITTYFFTKAVIKAIKRNNIKFDATYGHFVAPAGVAAARVGKKYNVCSFFAHGESTSWSIDQYGVEKLKKEFDSITGVIAVSTRNKNLVAQKGIVDDSKIKVFPNGYRPERFHKITKSKARAHFGWDNDQFIVGFCGSFDDRKGILRLEKAVDSINNDKIVFACAGKGELMPRSEKCILKEPVNNDELIYFYNAIDVFCLPTQNEGCCNAIVEAMACGCPIISSNKDFNMDILNINNSILIDPDNIDQIKEAIERLYNGNLNQYSNNSLLMSKNLTIEKRAKKIIEFMTK